MYHSFKDLALKKYGRILSRNVATKMCNQLIFDIVGDDARIERHFGNTVVVKCSNASAAAFLRAREQGILGAVKKLGITTIHYRT
ncbi:MAG: hypothetical protein HZA36_02660 [Parcubacteria group bacterium]|nr:hypothetical protein [Parcubacteria group bacterium]